jgi:ATP-dependent RNA helicase DDX51/DBP6
MFAARFDPAAIVTEPTVKPVLPLKRKVEEVENVEEKSEDESSDNSCEEEDQSESDVSEMSEEEDEDIKDKDREMKDAEEQADQDDQEQQPQQQQQAEHDIKFSSIISRFNQSIQQLQAQESQSEDNDEEDQVETHDIAPLPQPALPRDYRLSAAETNNNLNWLADPLYIKTTELKPFTHFQISGKILKNLQHMGFENAFASQIKTLELLIPEINNKLNPNAIKGDVLVNASTGSGKTLAYTIPVIQSLENRIVPRLRCIILVPTRPLIIQVYKTLTSVSRGIDLNIVTLGKSDMSLNDESLKLKGNVPDVIVSTPGRLVDHLNMRSFTLKDLQWCVIDEADRLLSQSFQDWSNVLISKLNEVDDGKNISKSYKPSLTKMIFSATLTTDTGKLSALQFHNPRLIIVNNEEAILKSDKIFSLPLTLQEHFTKFTSSQSSYKPLLLLKLLQKRASKHTLVFTKSNEATIRLSQLLTTLTSKLAPEITVNNISSQLNSSSRSKILQEFSQGSVSVLISTDLIARGLDLSTIRNVVNYDLPPSSREYVHRVGRTARAGQDGNAYTIVIGRGEGQYFEKIGRDINRADNVQVIELPELTQEEKEAYEVSLKELESMVFKKR